MDFFLDLFAKVLRYVVDRKGWLWGAALIACALGGYLVLRPGEVQYPANLLSPEYQENMDYLIKTVQHQPPDLPKGASGIFGSHLAVVSERDFPLLTKKLRQEFRNASEDGLLFHLLVLGGKEVRDIVQPLLAASKEIHMPSHPGMKVVIVSPSTISDETERILKERGLSIQRIGTH